LPAGAEKMPSSSLASAELQDAALPVALRDVPGAEPEIQIFQPAGSNGCLQLDQPIATGRWSTVYTGCCKGLDLASAALKMSLKLPPESRQVYAIKAGSGKTAVRILLDEARILTIIMRCLAAKEWVVPFYGYDLQHKALVMEYIPLTLDKFMQTWNNEPAASRKTSVLDEIFLIARHLISGLVFIHDQTVIHGDIKPSNILLRPIPHQASINRLENCKSSTASEPSLLPRYQPLYCDFSASRLHHSSSVPNESAGTYDFMAPELFSKSVPDNYATAASDVYALAVTLIYAVGGKSPYAGAANAYVRRAMAMRGLPLEALSMDCEAMERVQTVGLEKWVEGAVRSSAAERWKARDWAEWLGQRQNQR